MNTHRSVFALLAFSAVLAGCGGSSSGSGGALGVSTGRYTGTYENTGDSPFSGTVALTIDSDGTVTGTTNDTRFGEGRVGVSSRISQAGRLTLNVIYEDASPTVSTVTVANLTRPSVGVLSGSGRETRVTVSNPVTITLNLDTD